MLFAESYARGVFETHADLIASDCHQRFFATPYILPRSPGKNASGKPVRIKYRLIIARVMFVRGCDRIYENFTTHILCKRETLLNPRMIG